MMTGMASGLLKKLSQTAQHMDVDGHEHMMMQFGDMAMDKRKRKN